MTHFVLQTRFFLIRHAESEGNVAQKFQGRSDTPLSELGKRQALLLQKKLENEKIDVVYYSPLVRARDTAQIAFGSRHIPIIAENMLLARNFGPFDGLKLEEAKKFHPLAEELYAGRISDINLDGVESISSLQDRSLAAIKEISSKHQGQNVAMVTHLFWIKSLLSKILGISFQDIRKMLPPTAWFVPAASITIADARLINGTLQFDLKMIGDESYFSV